MKRLFALLPLVILLPCLASGCAWSNPDNRPVWNAFEATAVPDDSTWFALSLPITVPLGLLAAIIDTFIAHPIQIIDDAAGDAGDCWSGIGQKFDDHYYTQSAYLPVRALIETPGTFILSFLGRSMFDIKYHSYGDRQAGEVQDEAQRKESKDAIVAWLDKVVVDHKIVFPYQALQSRVEWGPDLLASADAALIRAGTQSRLSIYDIGVHFKIQRVYEAGLADRDPGLRFKVLWDLPVQYQVREDLLKALRDDPIESIRELARRR